MSQPPWPWWLWMLFGLVASAMAVRCAYLDLGAESLYFLLASWSWFAIGADKRGLRS